jgi:hypothetical protein
VKVNGGAIVAAAVADGGGVTDRIGDALRAETVGVGAEKTTRDGTHPRTTTNPTRNTTARNASRARDATS